MLGEGWHRGAGTPHAEVAALTDARERGNEVRGSTAVVTLEPCNHTGRTGPCSEALIADGVARVVVSVPDPNPVAAGGVARLREAGVDVQTGVLPDEGRELLGAWLPSLERGRPFVTLKLATSLDGRIAAADGSSRWITSEVARHHAHELRSQVGAIVVGTGTALTDDPSLTARNAAGELHGDQPLRVVVGLREVPADARLRGAGGELVALPPTTRPSSSRTWPSARSGTSSSREARPSPRRSCAPASSTRSTPTSRRSCSAPGHPPWPTSASPPSATPSA